MLTSITVRGFKSLEQVEVPLGCVNVFIGANGSGKSNLLEALGFVSAVAEGRLDDQALARRGVRTSAPALYRSSFAKTQPVTETRIETRFDTPDCQLDYTLRLLMETDERERPWPFTETRLVRDPNSQAVLYERDTGIPGMFAAPSLADGIANQPIGDATRLRTDVLADYAVFAPNTPTLRGMEADIRQRIPVGLAGGQLAEAVQELLEPRQGKFGALDLHRLLELLDWVNEIAVVPPSRELTSASVPTTRSIIRFTDRWMGRDRNQLSAYDASEGALYVLFALVLALHPHSPRLFAIENLDQNMHPRLARATVRLFCELMLKAEPERQVLLTIHNPLVLDSLNLRDDRIRLFTVERDVEGTMWVDRVPVSDEMLRVIENGLSLSNLWVMGRLGGVPDLF